MLQAADDLDDLDVAIGRGQARSADRSRSVTVSTRPPSRPAAGDSLAHPRRLGVVVRIRSDGPLENRLR